MSDQPTSSDPYGQGQQPPSSGQPGAYQQPSPQQPPPQPPPPGYGQAYPAGYPAPPRRPLDLARLASIAAWVVLGLFAVHYLYFISNDDNGGEFVDRFFGGMDRLGEGILYTAILHAVAIWLRRNQSVE